MTETSPDLQEVAEIRWPFSNLSRTVIPNCPYEIFIERTWEDPEGDLYGILVAIYMAGTRRPIRIADSHEVVRLHSKTGSVIEVTFEKEETSALFEDLSKSEIYILTFQGPVTEAIARAILHH